MLYLTLSSLTVAPDKPTKCLCGAFAPIRPDAAYFDCAACGQRWWALAPNLVLKQIESLKAA